MSQMMKTGTENAKLMISLDLDGVLADLNGVILPYFAKRSSVPITIQRLVEWDWMHHIPKKLRQWTIKEAYEIYAAAWSKFSPDVIRPCKRNLAEATAELNKLGHVDIVTSHDATMRGQIRYWLRKHGVKYKQLVLIGKSGVADATAEYGAQTKIRNGYNVFIDDNPALAKVILGRNNGEVMFLFDQKWNRRVKEDGKHVFRVKNLMDVVRILNARANSVVAS